MDGEKTYWDFLTGAAGAAGNYFGQRTTPPPAATANVNARKQDLTLPLIIGGAVVLVLVLVLALGRK